MLLFAAPALAQDEPDQPMPAPPTDPSGSPAPAPAPAQPVPPPPPGYAPAYPPPPGAVVALSDRDLKRFLDADQSYRSGKRRRLAGILTTTIGGGLTIAMAATFGFVYSLCDSVSYDGSSSGNNCGEPRNIAIGFLVGFGASLAIGIPLWASGQSQMNEVRRTRFQEVVPMHRPRVLLDLGRDRAGLGLAWRFQ
jgi:hypothetical protein